MSEIPNNDGLNRADFLRGASVAAAGLLIPKWAIAAAAQPLSSEQFSSKPSWEQDFSQMPDGPLSRKDWNFETGNTVAGYNGEAETYTDSTENVRIENGLLVIEALKENKNGRQYTSSRINTLGKFDFTHGKLEVAMKLPEGVGTWPAAWLLPSQPKYDPASYGIHNPNTGWLINGEIDFAEAVGTSPGVVYPAVHTFSNIKEETTDTNPPHVNVPDDTRHFHAYGVEKLPSGVTFTFDGKPYYSFAKQSNDPRDWPFEQPYYLILNLAMGGSWGGMDKSKFPPNGIDNSKAPWTLEVSSINYYDLKA